MTKFDLLLFAAIYWNLYQLVFKGLKQKQTLNFTGSAGQSFGVWNAAGLNLKLNGGTISMII